MLFSMLGGPSLFSIKEFQRYIVKHEKAIIGSCFHHTIVC